MKFYGSNDVNVKHLSEVPQAHLAYCYNPDKVELQNREITVDFGFIQVTATSEEWDTAISAIQTVQSDLYAQKMLARNDIDLEEPSEHRVSKAI